ncbi:PAS domain S-box protein [Mucilaginibacter sp. CAU 1740]|uniref:sensor histidine kinase n=1 Tax=Mucilaginibacter sp. CAU 1740 TaxID=3140365 RepID=UPI00325A9719
MQSKLDLYQRVTPLAGLGIFERNFFSGEFYWNSVIRKILDVDENFSPQLEESLKFYKNPQEVRELIDLAIHTQVPQTKRLELITAKNDLKWVTIWIQADVLDGKCMRIYGTLQDITKEIKLQRLLEEREMRFSKAFDHAPIGMALVSLQGGWIKVNRSLCNLLGYDEEGFLQHTFQDFTHPEDLDSDLKQLQELLHGTINTYSMEKRYFHHDGRIIWALLNVSLVHDEFGVPLYFVSQIKDITERKKNSEIIRGQNSRLLNFAHIVSHNLRSHTGNIQMLTNMIITEDDRDEQMNLIKMLNVNAGNLLDTLSNLNEIVKVHDNGQAGKVSVRLEQEVQRVIDILSATIMQSEAQVDIIIAKDLSVEFNPAYLESILINLISNTFKYRHPDRTPRIIITAKKTPSQVLLSVQDNGLGIDLNLHGHKLFGMYKTFHRHPDARGMGLFLVKNQVEAMGGRIWAESEPGTGTTFTIEFE